MPPSGAAYVPPPGRRDMYDTQGRLMLKGLTLPELEDWALSVGETKNRAVQLWRWMYQDGNWMHCLEDTLDVQNGFSSKFIGNCGPSISVSGGLKLVQVVRSKDGTRKLAFELTQGAAAGGIIETVLIPVVRAAGLRDRITLCVSSQVGCAMNCQFCYTGRMGLLGHLSTAQIVEQVVAARRFMADEGDTTPVTNLVFMGMGEPLHNTEAVLAAIAIMTHPLGLHLSHNKITVSTVGLVDEIRQFAARSNAQLAVSLHATTDEVRDWIVPVNRRYDLAALMACLAELYPASNPDGPKVLIEYVMLDRINDTQEDALRLLEMLRPVATKVNLICFNTHDGTMFQPSEAQTVLDFRSTLIQGGLVCTIRDSRGDDEMAACGQLGNMKLSLNPSPMLAVPPAVKARLEAPSE